MDLFELNFAKIKLLREDIAEVIINKGIEIDEAIVKEYHDFLIKHLRAPFSLLINKINPYSYTFVAQQKLGTIKEINAMAVVVYSHTSRFSTQSLASQTRSKKWDMRIFTEREIALEWLESKQGKIWESFTPSTSRV